VDADRFEDLIRSFPLATSRRGVLAGLTSGLLAVAPFGLGSEDAATKKRKHKKKKKKKRCTPSCSGKVCGDDSCGGLCGRCDATQTCQGGNCACPAGTKPCGGACVPSAACCPICNVGQSCLGNGSCATVCDELADCPCADAECALSTEGTRHCTLPMAAGNCQTLCDSSADCPPGRQCQEFASEICPPFQRCVALCTR
jgi:hypothetical protein